MKQSGEPQNPGQNLVELSVGWSWIGYAASENIEVNNLSVVNGSWTMNDQIKTRSGSAVTFTTYDGSNFQGGLLELKPGVGYEVKVAQAVTFSYTTSASGGGRMLATGKQ